MKAKMIFGDAKHSAVLNDFPLLIAQAGIERLANRTFRGVARDYAIDELQCIFPPNLVLEQWRYVDQCSAVPNCMIFVIVEDIVGTSNQVTGPCTPVLANAQGGRA